MSEKIDVLDMIIDILCGYEKRQDELTEKLETLAVKFNYVLSRTGTQV